MIKSKNPPIFSDDQCQRDIYYSFCDALRQRYPTADSIHVNLDTIRAPLDVAAGQWGVYRFRSVGGVRNRKCPAVIKDVRLTEDWGGGAKKMFMMVGPWKALWPDKIV